MSTESGWHILLLSPHGLLRGRPELGRDPDTGGQILYVLELARTLGEHPAIERVDLVTRLIRDPQVDDDYAREREPLGPKGSILRIPCGPERYIRKELLWPYMDEFVDNLVRHLRERVRVPDLVHGHYADGGYAAARLAALLGVPMAFTGHSLGRVKLQRLRDQGFSEAQIEKRYHISRRIEAEETALEHAAFVIASSSQEVEEQYRSYEDYQPERMLVTPPGVDLRRFSPPRGRWSSASEHAQELLRPFLRDLRRPMVFAVSRADPRKNISRLIRAFGENRELRELANLVIVAGNRERLDDLDEGARGVLLDMLKLIDEYDLYGRVACPKAHRREDISHFYRLAARTKGVFVNPAVTEPFGLTVLEAAASGLPVVATHCGGPKDILEHCRNGLLVDPLDTEALGRTILDALSDTERWRRWSRAGLSGAKQYTWTAHINRYVRAVRATVVKGQKARRFFEASKRLITFDRVVLADIDNTLTGDRAGLTALLRTLREAGSKVLFGVATGRSLAMTLDVLEQWNIPTPHLLITSVGSAIRYGPALIEDRGWERHICYRWRPERIREVMMDGIPGVTLQGPAGQGRYKVSYDVDMEQMPPLKEIRARLRRAGVQARLIFSHNAYLDVLPIRASKGTALRYFALRWNISLERCLVAGDSGNDVEMLTGSTKGVVVGNHDPELASLRGQPQIYFATAKHAWGILEGIAHYDFLGNIRTPDWTENPTNAIAAAR